MKSKTLFFILVIAFASRMVLGQTQLPVNDIRVTNRAQCALDSALPTDSAFLIIDGFNAGKTGHGLALNITENPEELAKEAMKEFRLSIFKLSEIIIAKLEKGQLPLLPLSPTFEQFPNYSSVLQNCQQKAYCEDLNSYVASLWRISELGYRQSNLRDWQTVDGFTSNSFLPAGVFNKKSCVYLRKFSPLQGNLHNSQLSVPMLENLAEAALNPNALIAECDDQNADIENRNAALQFDLQLKPSFETDWNTKGHRFWNSFKIYLSWAWRSAPGNTWSNHPIFKNAFRSLSLEESIMFIPNGCKSITKPECSSEELSVASLRELAKPAPGQEHRLDVPPDLDDQMLERGARSVNNDFLGTLAPESAAKWVEGFRKQFVMNRGINKTKLQTAVQFLNILVDSIDPTTLAHSIESLVYTNSESIELKNEAYYLCTELRLAGDQRLDFLKSDIDKITELAAMTKATEFSHRSLPELIDYFDSLSKNLMPLCESLEKSNLWQTSNFTIDKMGFQPWAKEVLQITKYDTSGSLVSIPAKIYGPIFLSWGQSLGSNSTNDEIKGNAICVSAIECARHAFKSAVDLYAVSTYADAFLPVASVAPSPNLFNPYAELTACKIYDPWFQTKKNQKKFFNDLANSALFGWNMIPIYMDVNFKAPKVTSFNRLIKDGAIQFDPNIEATKAERTLVADFGPLMGAPCAISISPNSPRAFDAYAFTGVSVNYCDGKEKHDGFAEKPDDIRRSPGTQNSYCGGCSLNFEAVTRAGSSLGNNPTGINPFKAAIYLYKSIHQFLKAKKDDVNIPRSYKVNLSNLIATYKAYGRIPKECVDSLGDGLKCFNDYCSAKAVDLFEKETGATVYSAYPIQNNSVSIGSSSEQTIAIKTSLCPGDIYLPITQCRGPQKKFSMAEKNRWQTWDKQCREKLKEEVQK